jgi:hypothetical protein
MNIHFSFSKVVVMEQKVDTPLPGEAFEQPDPAQLLTYVVALGRELAVIAADAGALDVARLFEAAAAAADQEVGNAATEDAA